MGRGGAGLPEGGTPGKGNSGLHLLWALQACGAQQRMVLTAPTCSMGCCVGPVAGPKGCDESGCPGPSLPQSRLCSAPLNERAFESNRNPAWPKAGLSGTSGMAPCVPLQTPVQRTCRRHGQQTATTRSTDRRGPAARLPIHRGGLPGSSCRKNPCLTTGARSSRSFRTGWGLSAAEEGREELHTQSRAGNTKQGSVIPRQNSIGPLPSLGSCLGPRFQNSLLRDLDFSKTCTGFSLCWAGGAGRSSHDRQAEG